jgi:phosphatidylglycerol:prolipoprotein diacylglycerol transferase
MFPHLFHIGAFSMPTYGLLVALGFLAGLWLTTRLAARSGISSETVLNLGVFCALAGIVGAKIAMIVMSPDYRAHPGEIFTLATLQSAGIFYGGLIAALGAAFWYMRRHRLPFLSTADQFAPGVALGHGIGRLGCFAAGCCWGRPTHLPWAVVFSNPDAVISPDRLGVPLHPTQLYEALAEWIICAMLLFFISRRHRDGQVLGLYLLLYGAARFVIEFYREHDSSNPLGLGLSLEQWIALALMLCGAALLTRLSFAPSKQIFNWANR